MYLALTATATTTCVQPFCGLSFSWPCAKRRQGGGGGGVGGGRAGAWVWVCSVVRMETGGEVGVGEA